MQSVYMHVDGTGVIWTLAKCRVCGEVHKFLAVDAIAKGVRCKSCNHLMELAGAVIAATTPAPALTSDGNSSGKDASYCDALATGENQ